MKKANGHISRLHVLQLYMEMVELAQAIPACLTNPLCRTVGHKVLLQCGAAIAGTLFPSTLDESGQAPA